MHWEHRQGSTENDASNRLVSLLFNKTQCASFLLWIILILESQISFLFLNIFFFKCFFYQRLTCVVIETHMYPSPVVLRVTFFFNIQKTWFDCLCHMLREIQIPLCPPENWGIVASNSPGYLSLFNFTLNSFFCLILDPYQLFLLLELYLLLSVPLHPKLDSTSGSLFKAPSPKVVWTTECYWRSQGT